MLQNTSNLSEKETLTKLLIIVNNESNKSSNLDYIANDIFSTYFDFTQRLKHKHSNLSSSDLKLATFLRMNLSTKEIAPLLNISSRGVEIGRYRLRKKLNITRSINLNEYMISF